MSYLRQMRALSALNGHSVSNKPKEFIAKDTRKLLDTFSTRNSIHGINNFLRESTGIYERFTWFFVLTITIIGMVYVSLILSQRFTEGKLQTVIDTTTYPVYEIVFPTITICNHNRLNWKRLDAAKSKFLPLEKDKRKLDLFARFIASFDGIFFGKFDTFGNVSNEPLQMLNDVNFTNVFAFMTWTCEEMLGDCKWRDEKFKCCEVFYQQKSELGLCFAFNGVQNEESKWKAKMDPFYPLHNSNYGPNSALKVKVFIRPEDHLPGSSLEKGIIVMVHEPPVWQKDAFFIPWNTETSVEIDPVIFYYDNDTRNVPSSLRKCVFDDEHNSDDFKSIPGYVYMMSNCFSQCRQEHLMRYCNCTIDLLYPPGDIPPCQAPDFHCIYEQRDEFRYLERKGQEKYVFNQHQGMKCKCFRNCLSLNYITEVRPSYLPTNILGNMSYVDLDVHYRFDFVMVYRTNLVFGWVDLMVSFGGIAGLFLGCSLISAVEIFYFLTVDCLGYIYRRMRGTRNWQIWAAKEERNNADFRSIPGYVYMLENCFSQCHQEHLMRYCNCTLDLLYPPGTFPPCQASNFHCIYRHRDDLENTKRKGEEMYVYNQHEGMTCKCFRNCLSLNYITEVRSTYLPRNILGNLSYVDLDVHYRFDSIILYRTSLVFGWVDLMVSFGGIAGLFLGCSLISAVEILYFLIFDILRFVYRRVGRTRKWQTRRTTKVQIWMVGQYNPPPKYLRQPNSMIFHIDKVPGRNLK